MVLLAHGLSNQGLVRVGKGLGLGDGRTAILKPFKYFRVLWGSCTNADSNPVGLGWGLRTIIFNKPPHEAVWLVQRRHGVSLIGVHV